MTNTAIISAATTSVQFSGLVAGDEGLQVGEGHQSAIDDFNARLAVQNSALWFRRRR